MRPSCYRGLLLVSTIAFAVPLSGCDVDEATEDDPTVVQEEELDSVQQAVCAGADFPLGCPRHYTRYGDTCRKSTSTGLVCPKSVSTYQIDQTGSPRTYDLCANPAGTPMCPTSFGTATTARVSGHDYCWKYVYADPICPPNTYKGPGWICLTKPC